jgi:hypothetical protein
MHLTDPLPGAWTVDMNCKWQGAITDADLTCTAVGSGYAVPGSLEGTTTTVWPKSEIQTGEYIGTFAVVTASGPVSSGAPASQTPGGSAAPQSRSSGFAPAAALPTGAMALVGGAAGVFAAALAL